VIAEALVAGVVVLDVADEIRFRLGEPTVGALSRRFGPGGRCLTCGRCLGAEPLSVRAYRDGQGVVTLIAYHAGCAASAWLDVAPDVRPRDWTWAAAVTSVVLRLPGRWRRGWRLGRAVPGQLAPVLLVRPRLEIARVRPVSLGESVNADLEWYAARGFADPGPPGRSPRVKVVGRAWTRMQEGCAVLCADVGSDVWSAGAARFDIGLVQARGGVLIGVMCERDPAWLASRPGRLEQALGNNELLLGWAPLPGTAREQRSA